MQDPQENKIQEAIEGTFPTGEELYPDVIEMFWSSLDRTPGLPMWIPCFEGILCIWAEAKGDYRHRVITPEEMPQIAAEGVNNGTGKQV